MSGDPVCPTCGGWIWLVLDRAWCMERYDVGGCGTHWPRWSERSRAKQLALDLAAVIPAE